MDNLTYYVLVLGIHIHVYHSVLVSCFCLFFFCTPTCCVHVFYLPPPPLPIQLEMITDLLGSPPQEDLKHITSQTSIMNLLAQKKPAALRKLYALSRNISHEAVHLLMEVLVFNPVSWTS